MSADASAPVDAIARRASAAMVTLVCVARDEEHNNTVVQPNEIERRLRNADTRGRPSGERKAR